MVEKRKLTQKSPRELAMKYEKEAREKSYASSFTTGVKYDEYVSEVTKLHERAGDEWIRQFSREINPRGKINDLHYAINNYKFAVKKAEDPAKLSSLNKKLYLVTKKAEELESQRKKESGLQKKLYPVLSIITLTFALLFVGFNLTGNAIGGINLNDMKWLGACFFACGLVFSFLFLRDKKGK